MKTNILNLPLMYKTYIIFLLKNCDGITLLPILKT